MPLGTISTPQTNTTGNSWWDAGDRGARDLFGSTGGMSAFVNDPATMEFLKQTGAYDNIMRNFAGFNEATRTGKVSETDWISNYLKGDLGEYFTHSANDVRNQEQFANMREKFFRNWMGDVYKGTSKEKDYDFWKDRGFNTSGGAGVSAAAPSPIEGAQPAPRVNADPMTQPALANAGLTGGATQTSGAQKPGGTFQTMAPGGVAQPPMAMRPAGGFYGQGRRRTGYTARSGNLGSNFKRVAPAVGAGRGMPVRPIGPS